MSDNTKERMNVVIVGHVDHGKSTVIGRLLADTGSLPDGKLEQVRAQCERNARPFEYAFLLDALKDEQAQGITIDSARCFFETEKRHYIVTDAPGHIEFLKNMVTGAARAEAALLVIDAKEGIRENSKRHGYLVSMLGIKQVVVLVNKMDLPDYDQGVFDDIVKEYTIFLDKLGVKPDAFIPVSAREGDNIACVSDAMPWYKGLSVLDQMDAFSRRKDDGKNPLRFPVQDIYKFTASDDDRRLVAGTVATGSVSVGDEVVFLPSGKESKVSSVERFNAPKNDTAVCGEALGVTLETQIYINPGEIMARKNETPPEVTQRFKANIFWMSRAPLIQDKTYKLKLGTVRCGVKLVRINQVVDATELNSEQNKQQVDRHDVAEVVLETIKPIALDKVSVIESTGRFVLVDNYEISGGGIVLDTLKDEESILDQHVKTREEQWQRGSVTPQDRAAAYRHKSKFVLLCGQTKENKSGIAKSLEARLFADGFKSYYLGVADLLHGLDADMEVLSDARTEHLRRMGELSRIITESGMIFITAMSDLDDYDVEMLKRLNEPHEIMVVNVGENNFTHYTPDLMVDGNIEGESVEAIYAFLRRNDIIPLEYYI